MRWRVIVFLIDKLTSVDFCLIKTLTRVMIISINNFVKILMWLNKDSQFCLETSGSFGGFGDKRPKLVDQHETKYSSQFAFHVKTNFIWYNCSAFDFIIKNDLIQDQPAEIFTSVLVQQSICPHHPLLQCNPHDNSLSISFNFLCKTHTAVNKKKKKLLIVMSN